MLARLRWDPRLLEEVVGLELKRREERGERELAREYHRRADPLYRLAAERRDREFAALHRRLFQTLGFEAPAAAVVGRHRGVLAGIESLTFLRVPRPPEEGADLGAPAPDGRRPAVVRLRAARFLSVQDLGPFLDHELAHLEDLLDPAFAHDPDSLAAIPLHRRRLVQGRYRLAWAVSVDGRLSRRGRSPLAERAERRRELAAGFPALTAAQLDRLFEVLWRDDRPTHPRLLAIAAAREAPEPLQPGGACALCGFPTHRWAERPDERLSEAIRRDVPAWQPEARCCERCLELYELRSSAPA